MARLPWLSVSSKSSELESVSSVSLLHSIYGSQVSQILLASDDSDARLPQRLEPTADRSRRPKSSPAVTRLERLQRSTPSADVAFRARPATARVRRQASSALTAARPRSALPVCLQGVHERRLFQQHHVQSSMHVEDLEDELVLSRTAIHETKPVALTRVPEYVNFWQGKPLSQRDLVVPSHTRRAWKRPKSDYGSRFLSRGNGSKALATVLEGADDSLASANKSGGDTSRNLPKSGGHDKNSKDGRSSFSGAGWGGAGGNVDGRKGKEMGDDNNRRFGAASVWAQRSQGTRRKQSTASSSGDDDDHFHQDKHFNSHLLDIEGSCSQGTRFELPMDILLLERMSPLQYLKSHCIISDQHMLLCSRVFTVHDKDRDAHLSKEELKGALNEALNGCLSAGQAEDLLELVQYPPEARADLQLFASLCCLAGRAFSLNILPTALGGKEVIESVDFEALEWKLRGCSIGPPLRNIFALL